MHEEAAELQKVLNEFKAQKKLSDSELLVILQGEPRLQTTHRSTLTRWRNIDPKDVTKVTLTRLRIAVNFLQGKGNQDLSNKGTRIHSLKLIKKELKRIRVCLRSYPVPVRIRKRIRLLEDTLVRLLEQE